MDSFFHWAAEGDKAPTGAVFTRAHIGWCQAILDLIDQVPPEIVATGTPGGFSEFTAAQSLLVASIENARASGHQILIEFPDGRHPIAVVRRYLDSCRDEAPSAAFRGLAFLADPELEQSLGIDIGSVERAIAHGDWKAATVLGASVIEALLLWALQQQPDQAVSEAIDEALASKTLEKRPDQNLEKWVLSQYIEISAGMDLIKRQTPIEARLAKDFRNLIHPGKAKRFEKVCDRGTAHATFAALDHVVRDLAPIA